MAYLHSGEQNITRKRERLPHDSSGRQLYQDEVPGVQDSESGVRRRSRGVRRRSRGGVGGPDGFITSVEEEEIAVFRYRDGPGGVGERLASVGDPRHGCFRGGVEDAHVAVGAAAAAEESEFEHLLRRDNGVGIFHE